MSALAYPRVAGCRSRRAAWPRRPIGGGLTVWTSTQGPSRCQRHRAVGGPEERIRVSCPTWRRLRGEGARQPKILCRWWPPLGRPVNGPRLRSEHCSPPRRPRQVHSAVVSSATAHRGHDTAFTPITAPAHSVSLTLTPQSPPGPPRANSRGFGGTSSPTRPSPPPIAAQAGPKPPSCWTGCWIARRGASAWTPPSCGGGT